MSDSGKKTAAKTAMVPQKHGGALLPGGVPGNKGGGRPSNELRGSMREILEKGLPHLKDFVVGEHAVTLECPACGETVKVKATRPADQLKAIEIAGKFGLQKDAYDKDLIDELWDATEGVLDARLPLHLPALRVREAGTRTGPASLRVQDVRPAK